MGIVHLNGRYLPEEEALVPVGDRGFLFGDGIYEVTPAYRGRFFLFDRHRERMLKGLCALRIDADLSGLAELHDRLVAENDLADAEVSIVYIQITRGVAPRTHAFPRDPVPPTVYAYAKRFVRPAKQIWERGYEAITVPDRRWARADVKTINLLPNVLAQQAAADAGVSDALMVKDGVALEGAHNNFFAVFGDTVVTHPNTNATLPGVTRGFLIEMAAEMGVAVEERPIQVEELQWATEAFFTGTTTEIRPTVRIDGRPVGDGLVGPVTSALAQEFRRRTDAWAAGG